MDPRSIGWFWMGVYGLISVAGVVSSLVGLWKASRVSRRDLLVVASSVGQLILLIGSLYAANWFLSLFSADPLPANLQFFASFLASVAAIPCGISLWGLSQRKKR